MFEQRSQIDQIEITETGHLQVRVALLVLDNEGNEQSRAWHRTVVAPGADVEAQLEAVNAHLQAMGRASIAGEDAGRERLSSLAAAVHTPEIVLAHRQRTAHLAEPAEPLADSDPQQETTRLDQVV